MTSQIQERISLAAQTVALALAIFYAVGFVILLLHHSYFGISEFNLLRPKILIAGILFCIFLSLPIVEGARVYGMFGFTPMFPSPKRIEGQFDKRLYYLPLIRLVALLGIASAITLSISFFFQDPKFESSWLGWWAGVVVSAVIAMKAVRTYGEEHPVACAWLCILTVGWILFSMSHVRDWTVFISLSWFFGGAAVTQYIDILVAKPDSRRNINWTQWLLIPTIALSFFTFLIYPHIRWSLGGGAPLPITFRFVDKSPLDNKAQTEFWLIDESDAGFYVLDAPPAKEIPFLSQGAVFIPRSSISAIYFGSEKTDKH